MEPDQIFEGPNFIWNKYLMRLISLWPYQKPLEKVLTRAIMLLGFWSMAIPLIIRAVEEFFEEVIDWEVILENFALLMVYLALFVKWVATIMTEKKFKIMYEEIMRNWREITDEEDLAVLQRYANVGRKLTIYYTAYIYMSMVPYASLPLVMPTVLNFILPNNTHEKDLLRYSEYFIDQQEYFYYLCIHCLIGAIIIASFTIAIDTTFVACTQHLIGLLYVIDDRLKKLADMIRDAPEKTLKNQRETIHREVVGCIRIHQKAIELTEIIQDAYDYCFFFVAVCIVALFSTLTVNLLRNIHYPGRLYKTILLWLANLIYLFYVNWPGQKLIDACDEIFLSISYCSWYQFDPKTKTLILIMMMRSQKRLVLSAGPFLVMNFEYSGRLLRLAFSYFSVVLGVSE